MLEPCDPLGEVWDVASRAGDTGWPVRSKVPLTFKELRK